MEQIEKLPKFDVEQLLKTALRKLEASRVGGLQVDVVEAARTEIETILVGKSPVEGNRVDTAATLRRLATSLVVVSDPNVDSARMAIISASDMLRLA